MPTKHREFLEMLENNTTAREFGESKHRLNVLISLYYCSTLSVLHMSTVVWKMIAIKMIAILTQLYKP